MPATSVRDLEVKDDDLIAGTHGRGFLILDDVTPLRQIAANPPPTNAHLYAPQTAIRVRNDMNPPTPWPPDMATGQNPPDGAIIDYYLGPNISGRSLSRSSTTKATYHARSTAPIPCRRSTHAIPTPPCGRGLRVF